MYANSEGSGETARSPKPSLVAYVISTIISRAGSINVLLSMTLLILRFECTVPVCIQMITTLT